MTRFLAVSLLLFACNGKDETPGTTTDDTGPTFPDPTFDYDNVILDAELVSGLTDDAIAAHRMANMFLASAAVVAADEKVGDQLNITGEGDGFTATGDAECWERPEFPMWSFDISYQTCADNFGINGGVGIEDHPSGPLLFNYNTFTIEERVMGGTLAFDGVGAYDAPMYFHTYNTDRTTPGPDNPVQIGLEADFFTSGATWDGGTYVDLDARTIDMWGVLTLRPDTRDFTIVHGGVEPADVAVDQERPADAVQNTLVWQSCRCPQSGASTYDLDIVYSQLSFDLDSIEQVDDGVDDPVVTVDVDHTVSARAILDYTGCGEYSVDFDGEATSFTVPNDVIAANVSYLCDIAVIPLDRCLSVVQGVVDAGDFTVQVSQEQVFAAASSAVEADFDQGWCLTY